MKPYPPCSCKHSSMTFPCCSDAQSLAIDAVAASSVPETNPSTHWSTKLRVTSHSSRHAFRREFESIEDPTRPPVRSSQWLRRVPHSPSAADITAFAPRCRGSADSGLRSYGQRGSFPSSRGRHGNAKDRFVPKIASAAAICARDVRTEKPKRSSLQPEFVPDIASFARLFIKRRHFLVDEATDRVSVHLEVRIEPRGSIVDHAPYSSLLRA